MGESTFVFGGSTSRQFNFANNAFLFNAGQYGIYEITSLRIFNDSTSVMATLTIYIDTRADETGTLSGDRSGTPTSLYAAYENIPPKSWINVIDKNNPVYLYNNNSRLSQDTGGPIVVYDGSWSSTTSAMILYRYLQNNEEVQEDQGTFTLPGTRIDQNWG